MTLGPGYLYSASQKILKGVTYKVIVRNNFEIDADERGHGLEFRHPKGFMALGQPDHVLHSECSAGLERDIIAVVGSLLRHSFVVGCCGD